MLGAESTRAAAAVLLACARALASAVFFRRHVLGRYALSQPQLDRLWRAPQLQCAATYASTAKSLALCLIYAPLWPPAYALTAVLLLFSYVCFRVAIRKWFARPRPLDETLLNELRGALLSLLIMHVCVLHAVTAYARDPAMTDGLVRFIVLITLCSLSFLLTFRQREFANTTDGVPYDIMRARVGTPIEQYENPAAAVARRLRGLERAFCGALDQGRQRQAAQKKNTSVASSASGDRAANIKLRVCRKAALHSACGTRASPQRSAKIAPVAEPASALPSIAEALSSPAGAAAREGMRSRVAATD